MKRIAIVCLTLCALLSSCHSSRKSVARPTSALPAQTGKDVHRKADGALSRTLTSEAMAWIGTPYCYGGASRSGTDCSGMVMAIYESIAGLKLPRNSAKQQEFCRPVSLEEADEGDLVFFTTSKNHGRVNHVGLYIGNGSFVHASTSRGVIVSRLSEEYYKRHFHSVGRVPGFAIANEVKSDTTPPLPLQTTEPPLQLPAQPAPPEALTEIKKPAEPEAPQDSIRDEVRRAMVF